MSNFKSKLTFFQNAALQQQSHQHQPHQQQVYQQQYPKTRPPQNLSYNQKSNSHSSMANSTETQTYTSINKPSIVVPKPITSNSNFKSKLAFFNQQSQPLVPLHPHQNENASHQINNDHKTQYQSSSNKTTMVQTNSINNEHSYTISNKNYAQLSTQVVNNENTPQLTTSEFKAQPPKSFKDKIALISSIQQPMGIYDYKKKQNSNQSKISEPIQTFSETPIQTSTEFTTQVSEKPIIQVPPEPHLPSLTAGRARRPTRRPPSLEQSNMQQSTLPSSS